MIATKYRNRIKRPRKKVPEHLVYEILDGQPIHYRGYKDVLAGTKTLSEIMGTSGLQSLIITHLVVFLSNSIDRKLFAVLTGETGLHLNRSNNLSGDVLIFDKSVLPINAIDEYYIDIPPRIAIEVDISADPSDIHPDTYLYKKTAKLLEFGVEKVIWITTEAKKVTVATAGNDWHVKDWDRDVEVLDGITINIGKYLASEGSAYA